MSTKENATLCVADHLQQTESVPMCTTPGVTQSAHVVQIVTVHEEFRQLRQGT